MLKALQWVLGCIATCLLGISIFSSIGLFQDAPKDYKESDITTFKDKVASSGAKQKQLMDAFHKLYDNLEKDNEAFYDLNLTQEDLAKLLNSSLDGLPVEKKIELIEKIQTNLPNIDTKDIGTYIVWFTQQEKFNYAQDNAPSKDFMDSLSQYSLALFFGSLVMFLLVVLLTLIAEYRKTALLLATQAELLQKLDANTRATALLLKQRSQSQSS